MLPSVLSGLRAVELCFIPLHTMLVSIVSIALCSASLFRHCAPESFVRLVASMHNTSRTVWELRTFAATLLLSGAGTYTQRCSTFESLLSALCTRITVSAPATGQNSRLKSTQPRQFEYMRESGDANLPVCCGVFVLCSTTPLRDVYKLIHL